MSDWLRKRFAHFVMWADAPGSPLRFTGAKKVAYWHKRRLIVMYGATPGQMETVFVCRPVRALPEEQVSPCEWQAFVETRSDGTRQVVDSPSSRIRLGLMR